LFQKALDKDGPISSEAVEIIYVDNSWNSRNGNLDGRKHERREHMSFMLGHSRNSPGAPDWGEIEISVST